MVFDRYIENGVLFTDEQDPTKHQVSVATGVKILYPAVDGGEADTLVNPSANRVNNANFDGWK